MPQPATVIVVGAGLAGLACAVHLHRAGVAVRVLEASDGVGGRIRTDLVDGFRLDRGYQVFNTGYPEAARVLDIPALRLRPFTSGVIVFREGRRERVTLPWRHPRQALSGLSARVGTPVDKAVLAALTTRDLLLPDSLVRRRGGAERTTEEELRHWGASPEVVENLFRPFLAGVVLERELETSSRIFHLFWRSFVRGTIGLPALGMERIPEQLAERLPPDAVRLETAVGALTPTGVALDGEGEMGGEMEASAVVVAADPATAGRLLPGLPVPAMRPVTTFYGDARRHLRDRGGPARDAAPDAAAPPGASPGGGPRRAWSTALRLRRPPRHRVHPGRAGLRAAGRPGGAGGSAHAPGGGRRGPGRPRPRRSGLSAGTAARALAGFLTGIPAGAVAEQVQPVPHADDELLGVDGLGDVVTRAG